MQIIILIDSLGSGGAQKQAALLAGMLKAKGNSVAVVCYAAADFFVTMLEEVHVPIHWLIERQPLKRIFKVRKFIRSQQPDVVISFLEVPNLLNILAGLGGRTWKVITSERSAKASSFLTWKGKVMGKLLRYSDTLVCNSNNAKELWLQHYPIYQSKIRVIYNIHRISNTSVTYTPKRANKVHILVAASFQSNKNPINVLKAMAMLCPIQQSVLHLSWYGRHESTEGNQQVYEDALKLIDQNHLKDCVNLYDPTSDIINKMATADIIALFSDVEGMPNSIIEGMALGKPILMTKVSDFKLLVDEQNGIIVEDSSIASIKKALITASQLSAVQLERMGNASKTKAVQFFESEKILQQWMQLF